MLDVYTEISSSAQPSQARPLMSLSLFSISDMSADSSSSHQPQCDPPHTSPTVPTSPHCNPPSPIYSPASHHVSPASHLEKSDPLDDESHALCTETQRVRLIQLAAQNYFTRLRGKTERRESESDVLLDVSLLPGESLSYCYHYMFHTCFLLLCSPHQHNGHNLLTDWFSIRLFALCTWQASNSYMAAGNTAVGTLKLCDQTIVLSQGTSKKIIQSQFKN